MPAFIDVAFVFLLLGVTTIFEYVYFWPRFRADAAAGRPGVRIWAYRRGIIAQWFFALFAIGIWIARGRPWSAMSLTLPRGWHLAVAGVIIVAAVALTVLQLWSVLRLPISRRIAVRPRLEALAFLLPRTRREEAWFVILSATAGFCEELLYRGYLVWFCAPWLGTVGGMLTIVVVFGLSHAYQGRQGTIKATIAGAVMAAIVLVTGSLIPAMIAHMLIDVGGGTVGYLLLRDYAITEQTEPAPVAELIPST
jgi:uncharacterized protein